MTPTTCSQLTELANLGATFALEHDKRTYSKDQNWYFRVRLEADDVKVEWNGFKPTAAEAVEAGHTAIMRVASRGLDLRQLAPPVEAQPAGQIDDEIPF